MVDVRDEVPADETPSVLAVDQPTGEPEWDDRKLCPDGGCVGLIGDDGKCNVCGRSAA
jgi:hypothetical protein